MAWRYRHPIVDPPRRRSAFGHDDSQEPGNRTISVRLEKSIRYRYFQAQQITLFLITVIKKEIHERGDSIELKMLLLSITEMNVLRRNFHSCSIAFGRL